MVAHETNGQPRNRQAPPKKADSPLGGWTIARLVLGATGPIRPTNRPWESGVPATGLGTCGHTPRMPRQLFMPIGDRAVQVDEVQTVVNGQPTP